MEGDNILTTTSQTVTYLGGFNDITFWGILQSTPAFYKLQGQLRLRATLGWILF